MRAGHDAFSSPFKPRQTAATSLSVPKVAHERARDADGRLVHRQGGAETHSVSPSRTSRSAALRLDCLCGST